MREVLKHQTDVASLGRHEALRSGSLAIVDRDAPAGRPSIPEATRSSVVLPQPDGPSRHTIPGGSDIEGKAVERRRGLEPALKPIEMSAARRWSSRPCPAPPPRRRRQRPLALSRGGKSRLRPCAVPRAPRALGGETQSQSPRYPNLSRLLSERPSLDKVRTAGTRSARPPRVADMPWLAGIGLRRPRR